MNVRRGAARLMRVSAQRGGLAFLGGRRSSPRFAGSCDLGATLSSRVATQCRWGCVSVVSRAAEKCASFGSRKVHQYVGVEPSVRRSAESRRVASVKLVYEAE